MKMPKCLKYWFEKLEPGKKIKMSPMQWLVLFEPDKTGVNKLDLYFNEETNRKYIYNGGKQGSLIITIEGEFCFPHITLIKDNNE
jgi:hypothetical protein